MKCSFSPPLVLGEDYDAGYHTCDVILLSIVIRLSDFSQPKGMNNIAESKTLHVKGQIFSQVMKKN